MILGTKWREDEGTTVPGLRNYYVVGGTLHVTMDCWYEIFVSIGISILLYCIQIKNGVITTTGSALVYAPMLPGALFT